jgi:GNAT superfamily N-acetyltransferase
MTYSVSRTQEDETRLLPRGIHLRKAVEDDEPATFDVMRRAMGYDMNWMHHYPTRRHLRSAPASSFWLAEEMPRFGKARIVGYAHSIVRDGVWCLTEFFVLPTHHRQGIGRALLSRCLEDGDRFGADTRLVLASQHPSADALYIRKAGCFPRLPMFLLSGPAANLQMLPAESVTRIHDQVLPGDAPRPAAWTSGFAADSLSELTAAPILLTPDVQERLNSLDRDIVGYTRAPEHRLWVSEMGGDMGASRLFRDAATDQIVGYAYFGPHASGPALAVEPALLPPMIAHVTRVARQYARSTQGFDLFELPEPYWAIAGTNETMLGWLLECGWQIVFQYLLMSTRPLGRLDRYACHNPLYML